MTNANHTLAWPVDGLTRIFPHDAAPANAARRCARGWQLACAGGETVTFQLGVRPGHQLRDLSARAGTLRSRQSAIPAQAIRMRYVDLVPMPLGRWAPAERADQIPGWYPDPLMDDNPWADTRTLNTPPAVALHFTLQAPPRALAGIYRGSIEVLQGDTTVARVPLEVEVWPFAIPRRPTFHVTNWFHLDCLTLWHRCAPWSERHWRIIDLYASEMAAHRQTVISTPALFGNFHNTDPMTLVDAVRTVRGSYRFDFRRLERWVRLFDRHGFRLFEMWHFASQGDGRHAPRFRLYDERQRAWVNYEKLSIASPVYRDLVRAFLGDLSAWLARRGLTRRFLLHVFDEPQRKVWPHYVKLAGFLKSCAPDLKHLDAISDSELITKFGAHVDIPVPCTPHLDKDEYYRHRAREGKAPLWWYTCCAPLDEVHANRFVAQPPIATRILQWQAFALGVGGYLHWGYNFWHRTCQSVSGWPGLTSYSDTTLVNPYREHPREWCVGDAAIVYPHPRWWEDHGPVSSLRYEAMREGLCDYELLRLLEKLSAQSGAGARRRAALTDSRRLLKTVRGKLAPTTGWCRDPDVLLNARRRIGRCIGTLI